MNSAMKRLVVLALVAACGAPVTRPPAIELVESAPIETTLDHADVANAAAVWVDMIAGARSSIDVAEFYASNAPGSQLEPVVRALEAAIRRGVKVRFLAEHSFVTTYPDTLDRLAKAGASVRHLDLGTGGILHAKYFVVDGREAFFGSQNFDWRALEHNLELGARVRDPDIARALAAIFARDWATAGGEPLPTARAPATALTASPIGHLPDGIAWDLPVLVEWIDRAKRSIRVQLLTYKAGDDFPDLEAALVRAAARGVTVELLVADWSKRAETLASLQSLARRTAVHVRFITIPAWSGGFIPYARVAHAKLMVVDDARAWLGTSNWERDYFHASRNVGLVISDPALAARLARWFDDAWGSRYAEPLDAQATYTPPRIGS